MSSINTPKKVEWTESYNCHTALVANGAIKLEVNWTGDRTESGFQVVVCGIRLKKLSPDLNVSKMRAITYALELIEQATIELHNLSFPLITAD